MITGRKRCKISMSFLSKRPCFLGIRPLELLLKGCSSFPHRLQDFKDFADAIEAVKDKGVVAAVASPDDVEAALKERSNFFQIKKAL